MFFPNMEKIVSEKEKTKMSSKRKKEKYSEEDNERNKSTVRSSKNSTSSVKSPREGINFQLSPSSTSSKKSDIYTPVSSEKYTLNITENRNTRSSRYSPRSHIDVYDSDEESPIGSERVKIFDLYNKKQTFKKKIVNNDDNNERILKLIEKLNDKLDAQNEEISKLKEKKRHKEIDTNKYISPTATGKTESSTSSEEDEETEKSKIPNYEDMDDEEREKYTILFETNFQLLKKSFPSLILSTPDVRALSLKTVHIIYCNLVNTVLIYQLAMKIKVVFIAGCAAVEYFGNKKYKIKVLKDLTLLQLKRIDRYSAFFVDCARSIYGNFSGEYPEWIKFIFNAGTSFLSFIAVQSVSHSLNMGSASHELLKEADRFVAPIDGTFKFRDDGIPDVPEVPEGLQNPENILKKVPTLIKTLNSDSEGFGEAMEEEIVKEKTKPIEVNYGEIY